MVNALQPNQVYIASITFKPLQGTTLRLPVHSVLDKSDHRTAPTITSQFPGASTQRFSVGRGLSS